jgi:hypothetical protein
VRTLFGVIRRRITLQTGAADMSRSDAKKGREEKKPKQDGTKIPQQSAYQAGKKGAAPTVLKIRSK